MARKFSYFLFLTFLFFITSSQAQEATPTKTCDHDTPEYFSVIDLLASRIYGDYAKIEALSSKKIKTNHLCSDLIVTDTIVAKNGSFENFSADLFMTTTLEAECANILHLLSDFIITNSLSAENANLKTLLSDMIITTSLTDLYGEIKNLISEEIDTEKLKASLSQLELILSSTIFVNFIDSEKACFENLIADSISTGTLHAASLDISNLVLESITTLTLHNDNYITNLRAMVSNRADYPGYTLGTDIDFDTIIDDKNFNLIPHPTAYIAPRSGYYDVTVSVKTTDVNIIPESPLSEHVDIFVNGTAQAQMYKEFNSARTMPTIKTVLLSSLIHLNQGDLVTFRYFANENAPGTATIMGSPFDNATWMIMHYLSTD